MSNTNGEGSTEFGLIEPHDLEIVLLYRRLRYLMWRYYDDIYDGGEDESDLLSEGFFSGVSSRKEMIETLRFINSY